MTRSITRSVEQLKSHIDSALDPSTIHHACRDVNHRWRNRLLDPVATIWVFALQILHGNTACMHARHLLPGVNFTDSAYCQARARLPVELFIQLFRRITRSLLAASDEVIELWHGHRYFYIDASTCSMPDTPELQRRFSQPTGQKPGCGFPVAKFVALARGGGGLLVDILIGSLYSHEAPLAPGLFKHLKRDDVLVGDRAFGSYVLLGMLIERGVHAVVRQQQRRKTDFRKGRCLGLRDQIIQWAKPVKRPPWMNVSEFASLPEHITLRQLEYRVESPGFRSRRIVLNTTLLDPQKYPLKDLAELYNDRWQIETYFRHLKQTMRMDILRCKSVEGVTKELWMFAIIYNLVRATMVQAGLRQGVPPDRISFIDTLRWLIHRRPDEPMPDLVVNPLRPGRHQPRAVKRRPKEYSRLTLPRAQMRKAMLSWTL